MYLRHAGVFKLKNMNFKYLLLFCYFFLVLFLQSCKEDDNTLPDNNTSPLNLTLSIENDSVRLKWNPLNVSTFKQYIVFRSLDSIPDVAEFPDFVINRTEIFITDDQEKIEHTDHYISNFEDIHYKVYAEFDDGRFIYSPTITIPSKAKALPFCFFHGAIIPETNHMIISTEFHKIIKYDFVQHKVLTEKEISSTNNIIRIGDAGNGMEVFVYSQDPQASKFHILDINSLEVKVEKYMGGQITDISPSDNGYFFLAMNNKVVSMQRSDLIALDTIESSLSGVRRLLLSPFDPNLLIDISSSRIETHKFHINGTFNFSDDVQVFFSGYLKNDINLSPDKNTLIADTGNTLIKTESLFSVNIPLRNSLSHVFDSQDNNYFYLSYSNKVQRYNIQTGEEITIHSGLDVLKFFDIGNQLILINKDPENSNDYAFITILDK